MAQWTKQDYLNWANSIARMELSPDVIDQVRRFDPLVADLVQANDDACQKVIDYVKSRLEDK